MTTSPRAATGGDFGAVLEAARATRRGRVTAVRSAASWRASAAPRRPITLVGAVGLRREVTFASADVETSQQDSLLCDLHTRVGVTNEQVPSWLAWTEPLAEAAPVS